MPGIEWARRRDQQPSLQAALFPSDGRSENLNHRKVVFVDPKGAHRVNPIVFALRRPITVMVLVVAVASGERAGRVSDEHRHLSQPRTCRSIYVAQPYGGMDPAQMEGLAHQLLRVPLPLHQRHPPRREQERPGHGPDEVVFPSRHRHGPGHGRDDRLRQPLAGLHAAGHRPPFVMRFDTGSVPVGYLVLSQRDQSDRRNPGPGAVQGPADVRQPAGRLGPAALRRQPAHRRRSASTPTGCARTRFRPTRSFTPLSNGQHDQSLGQRPHRRQMPIVPINSLVKQIRGAGDHPDPARQEPAVYIRDIGDRSRRQRYPHRLRAGQRPPGRLHPGDQAGRRLDAGGRQQRQEGHPGDAGGPAGRHQGQLRIRPVADCHPADVDGLVIEGLLGAVLTGLMVLLFLRNWRSVIVVVLNIPFALCGALVGAVADRPDDQPDDARRVGAGGRHSGRRGDGRSREHPPRRWSGPDSVASAVRRGNQQTAVPRLLAMLCVLAVFIPSFFMQGAARRCSCRCRWPSALRWSLPTSFRARSCRSSRLAASRTTTALHGRGRRRATAFERAQRAYGRAVGAIVRWRWLVVPAYLAVSAGVLSACGRTLGVEIFPKVDAGRFQLRLRAADRDAHRGDRTTCDRGTRADQEGGGKGQYRDLGRLRRPDPFELPDQRHLSVDGRARGGDASGGSASESVDGQRRATQGAASRDGLRRKCRTVRLSFEPADIVNEVMSFGSPTPVEVRVSGPNLAEDRAFAEKIREELAQIPSLRDLQFGHSLDYPTVESSSIASRPGISGVTAAGGRPVGGRGHVVEPFRRSELLARPQDRDRLPGAGRDPRPDHELDRPRWRLSRSSGQGSTGNCCSATSPRSSEGRCPANSTATT